MFFLPASLALATNKIIPSPSTHAAFLLKEFQPGAPTLIIFKDPYCSYCITALKKRSRLDNYNTYLFWAPILGEQSVATVDTYFQCEAPVNKAIFDSLIIGKSLNCSSEANLALRKLNDDMLSAYQPNTVPQFWFGGRQVSISQLKHLKKSISPEEVIAKSRLKITWTRYQSFAVGETLSSRHNMAVITKSGFKLNEGTRRILNRSEYFNWYIFDERARSSRKAQEFKLLLDLDKAEKLVFVLEGQILSEIEESALIPERAWDIFQPKR